MRLLVVEGKEAEDKLKQVDMVVEDKQHGVGYKDLADNLLKQFGIQNMEMEMELDRLRLVLDKKLYVVEVGMRKQNVMRAWSTSNHAIQGVLHMVVLMEHSLLQVSEM